MLSMYTSYECRKFRKEIILLTEEVQATLRQGKYLSCSHCGCRNIKVEKAADSLKECMKARSYKREHGALKQKI